jgi:hypothetical protein
LDCASGRKTWHGTARHSAGDGIEQILVRRQRRSGRGFDFEEARIEVAGPRKEPN